MLLKKLLLSCGTITLISLCVYHNYNIPSIRQNSTNITSKSRYTARIESGQVPEVKAQPMKLDSLYFEETEEVKQELNEEKRLLEQAGQGNPDAMKALGSLYLNFTLNQENQESMYEFQSKSTFWYKSAFQVYSDKMRRGDVSSTREIGIMYLNGYGTDLNEHRARKYLHKSAEKGDILAMYHLGVSYYTSKKSPNRIGAQLWLQKAASKGDASSMKMLGDIYTEAYERAKIGKEDAIIWYTKAIEQGETRALVSLGFFYEYYDHDYEQAFDFYSQAVELNHFQAHYHLGEMYKNGVGRDVNEEKMIIHYMRGAEGKNSDCMQALADCYAYGVGIEKDYTKAMKWYSKAVKRGSKNAEEKLLDFIYETDVKFE